MIRTSLARGVLVGFICAALVIPAKADLKSEVNNDIVAAVVGLAVAGVVAAVLIVHYSKKRTVTGCISSGPNGMTVTDEKDKQTYVLSGDTAGLTLGNRIRLRGKKIKSKDPIKELVWEAGSVAKNFGVCHP